MVQSEAGTCHDVAEEQLRAERMFMFHAPCEHKALVHKSTRATLLLLFTCIRLRRARRDTRRELAQSSRRYIENNTKTQIGQLRRTLGAGLFCTAGVGIA